MQIANSQDSPEENEEYWGEQQMDEGPEGYPEIEEEENEAEPDEDESSLVLTDRQRLISGMDLVSLQQQFIQEHGQYNQEDLDSELDDGEGEEP